MDNLTHSLAGWALGQAGLKEKSRKGLAALILGANAPDIDVFFRWVPWEPLGDPPRLHPQPDRRRADPAGDAVGPADAARPLAGGARHDFQERPRDATRAGCSRSATSARSRIPCSTCRPPIRSSCSRRCRAAGSTATACSSSISGCGCCCRSTIAWSRGARSAADAGFRTPGPGRARRRLRLHLPQHRPQRHRRRRGPRARSGGAAIFASPPPVAFWQRGMIWRKGQASAAPNGGCSAGSRQASRWLTTIWTTRSSAARSSATGRCANSSTGRSCPIAKVERSGCAARVIVADARYGLPGQNSARLYRETTMDLCAPGRLAKGGASDE